MALASFTLSPLYLYPFGQDLKTCGSQARRRGKSASRIRIKGRIFKPANEEAWDLRCRACSPTRGSQRPRRSLCRPIEVAGVAASGCPSKIITTKPIDRKASRGARETGGKSDDREVAKTKAREKAISRRRGRESGGWAEKEKASVYLGRGIPAPGLSRPPHAPKTGGAKAAGS